MIEISEWIMQWLVERHKGKASFDATSDLISSGAIDSFGMIELISSIEAEFAIEFDSFDFQSRGFTTIAGMTHAVQRHCQEL